MPETIEQKFETSVKDLNQAIEDMKAGILTDEKVDELIQEQMKAFLIEGKSPADYIKTLQDHVDALEVQVKTHDSRFIDNQIVTLKDAILEGLEANTEDVDSFLKGGKELGFDLSLKTDLTSATNLVNDTTNDIHLVPPQRSMDIVFDPERPVHMRDIIPFLPMTGNAFTFPKETAYTDGSGLTAENTASGNTAFTITQQSALTGTINAHVVLSNLMLEDFPALSSYLATRLTEKLLSAEDDEILSGVGVIGGLIAQATAFAAGGATVTDPQRYDVITMANKQIRTAEYRSTGILMHPTDVALMKLSKDSNNQYIMPFVFVQNGRLVVDMVPVLDNTAISAGTYVIGDWQRGASIYNRRNITLKFHDSDDVGDVTKDMSTVTISERIAFPVFRTTAFVTDTWAASITELTP